MKVRVFIMTFLIFILQLIIQNQLILASPENPINALFNYSPDLNEPNAEGEGVYKVFLPIIARSEPSSPQGVGGVEYGIAAQYPMDINIQSHPSVIYASSFDTDNWYLQDFEYTSWTDNRGYRISDPSLTFTPGGTLELQNIKNTHLPQIYHVELAEQDKTFVRWYRRYEPGYDFNCQTKSIGVYAKNPDSNVNAGEVPTGYDKFSAKLQLWEHPDGYVPKIYTYHPEQKGIYGDNLPQNIGETLVLKAGQWYSFEIMLKPNDAGKRNGEIKLWIDGVLKSYYPNMRFRDTDTLKINELEIAAYVGGTCTAPKDQKLWDDNVVLATEYIGPVVQSPVQVYKEIIVDNNDPGFSVQSGDDGWQQYTNSKGEHYQQSHHFTNPGTGFDTATWAFDITEAGYYDVYGWWYGGDWRSMDVPYIINHANGSTRIAVDQRTNGGQWNILGQFYFNVGPGSVSISDKVSSGQDIVADAIRLVQRPE